MANIEITKTDITRDAIGILAQCPNLEEMSISHCAGFQHEYRDELLARCPRASSIEVVQAR